MEYNAITCHVCGSPYYRVRACPENLRKRNMSSIYEVYQQIYSRYGVKTPRPSVGFKPLFARNRQFGEQEEGMHNWDSPEDTCDMPVQGPSSYADAAKNKNTSVTNRKVRVPQYLHGL